MVPQSLVRFAAALFCLLTAPFFFGAAAVDEEENIPEMTVTFVNEFPNTFIDLYWEDQEASEDDPERRRFEGQIHPRGGSLNIDTYLGHEFSYDVDGARHYISPPPPNEFNHQYLILAGEVDDFRVRCEVTTNSRELIEYFDVLLKPYWAPRGVSRFLQLVRNGYYDGVALNRVVPNFLTQFGIARDYETRMSEREESIWDDFPPDIQFEPGFLSFAGNGPDSRTTEVFIVMPGASEEQLDIFGENIWEAPFGVVDGDVNESALTRIYSGYGDMPPWGNGPDPNLIYEIDGYSSYLPEHFPKLDYIDRCYVVNEIGMEEDFSEGEF